VNLETTTSFARFWLESSNTQRQWTDGCDLPYEGAASAGNDLILGFANENEQFPKISREAMRQYALRRGDNPYVLVKMTAVGGPNRKLFGGDFGWLEVPFEDDLAMAEGL
jgi:hypothetical protein